MRVAVTGGTGAVGRFFVLDALARGDAVLVLSRTEPLPTDFRAPVRHVPFDLSAPPPPLDGIDLLVHAALDHLPGRYRGGEGDDPDGFRRANIDGTDRLFRAARAAGVARAVFLSSRAVYGDHPPGTALSEDLPPRPDTLYGAVKLAGEQLLADSGLPGVSLRATGVFGPPAPGRPHKWAALVAALAAGAPIPSRAGTEVFGPDLACAATLARAAPHAVVNVSDLLLDHRDLADLAAAALGRPVPLPARADPASVNAMSTARLRALGWRPSGLSAVREVVARLAEALP
jgi:UDP-glucose 4-epimerase